MQKIVVFGGTGMTGQCTVQYALDKGDYAFFTNKGQKTVLFIVQV